MYCRHCPCRCKGCGRGLRFALELLPKILRLPANFPKKNVCLLLAIHPALPPHHMSILAPEYTCHLRVTGAHTLIQPLEALALRVAANRKYIFATFAAKPCERFRRKGASRNLSCQRNPAKVAKPCESPGMRRKLTPNSYERFGWPETIRPYSNRGFGSQTT